MKARGDVCPCDAFSFVLYGCDLFFLYLLSETFLSERGDRQSLSMLSRVELYAVGIITNMAYYKRLHRFIYRHLPDPSQISIN